MLNQFADWPWRGSSSHPWPFQQARRREDDISIVTAGLRVRLQPAGGVYMVADTCFAFGGLAPTVVVARKAAAALVGRPWDAQSVEEACAAVVDELRVGASAPGGQPEYRTALAASAVFKTFVATSIALGAPEYRSAGDAPAPPVVDAAERSAARSWLLEPKPSVSGSQRYTSRQLPLAIEE